MFEYLVQLHGAVESLTSSSYGTKDGRVVRSPVCLHKSMEFDIFRDHGGFMGTLWITPSTLIALDVVNLLHKRWLVSTKTLIHDLMFIIFLTCFSVSCVLVSTPLSTSTSS
jgi:hypothetical protein